MNEGWVKLHRAVCESAVFEDAEILRLWIYILVNAAHKDHDTVYQGKIVHIKKGEFVTGRKILAREFKLSESKIYRMLTALAELGNIEIKSNNKYSVVTVVNWAKYQDDSEKLNNKRTANEQQLNNKRTTNEQQMNTTEEWKEWKEWKECKEDVDARACEDGFSCSSPTPTPTLPEIRNYCFERDSIVDPARFFNYYSRVGWDKCGDWQVKIEEWENNSFANGDRERVEKLKNYRSFENTDKQVIDLEIFDEAIPNYGG